MNISANQIIVTPIKVKPAEKHNRRKKDHCFSKTLQLEELHKKNILYYTRQKILKRSHLTVLINISANINYIIATLIKVKPAEKHNRRKKGHCFSKTLQLEELH